MGREHLLLVFSYLLATSLSEHCRLVNGNPGNCLPLHKCAVIIELLKNLQKPLPKDVGLLIKESFSCTPAEGDVGVCCPSNTQTQETPWDPLATVQCKYQDGGVGSCAPYNQCFPFLQLLQNLRKPLPAQVPEIVKEAFLCHQDAKSESPVPKICCPNGGLIAQQYEEISLTTSQPTPRPTAVPSTTASSTQTTTTPPSTTSRTSASTVQTTNKQLSIGVTTSSLQSATTSRSSSTGTTARPVEIATTRPTTTKSQPTIMQSQPTATTTRKPFISTSTVTATTLTTPSAKPTTISQTTSQPLTTVRPPTPSTIATTASTVVTTEATKSPIVDTQNQGSGLENHLGWNRLANLETCGRSMVMVRIVGGRRARLGQYPWIANIGYSVSGSKSIEYKCSGTLIGSRHILTAAHCVASLPSDTTFSDVRLGEHDRSNDSPDCDKNQNFCAPLPQDYKPVLVLVHPKYNQPNRFNNDIALIKMDREVIETDFVSPICLPLGTVFSYEAEASVPEVAGWGATDVYARNFSDVLQYISLPMYNFKDCSDLYRRQKVQLIDSQLCAGGNKGEDSCAGDSGSGLILDVEIHSRPYDPRWIQIGIVSFGPWRCASKGVPAVYTNVTSYLPWILDSVLL